MPNAHTRPTAVRQQARRRRVRLWLFGSAGAAVVAIAVYLTVSPLSVLRAPDPVTSSPTGSLYQVVVTMSGFAPTVVRVEARRPFAVRLVNPDSSFHTDGGGWHQFRVEALGIDVRVPPRSEQVQTFGALAPGRYEFYCDVCCGGKENPSMRGVLDVRG